MKRSHLGIVVLIILCASFWVVATHPMFTDPSTQIEPDLTGDK